MFRLLPALVALAGSAQSLEHPIVAIDVYGSAPVDLVRLRAALPYSVGSQFEPVKEITLADMPAEFRKLAGNNQFSFSPILIPDPYGWVLYIDLEPPNAHPPKWKDDLRGAAKLPPEILSDYEHAMDRLINGGVGAGKGRRHKEKAIRRSGSPLQFPISPAA